MKLQLTLEDYQKAGDEFWPKYFYTAKELGENVEPEQVLKVMESLASVAMRQKAENKIGPFGFNKKNEDKSDESKY